MYYSIIKSLNRKNYLIPFSNLKVSYIQSNSKSSVHDPKNLVQAREILCAIHDTYRTQEACVNWIERFILFHHKRHPAEMSAGVVEMAMNQLLHRLRESWMRSHG